jgi:hypothetical protein
MKCAGMSNRAGDLAVGGGRAETTTRLFIDGMTAVLHGRVERSSPKPEGTRRQARGVDGEGAGRATIVVAGNGALSRAVRGAPDVTGLGTKKDPKEGVRLPTKSARGLSGRQIVRVVLGDVELRRRTALFAVLVA